MNLRALFSTGDKQMRTCWVFDHPAHVRLLAPFIRESGTSDLIIACDRFEGSIGQGDE